MRGSLKGVLSRVNQLAERAQSGTFDLMEIITARLSDARRRSAERHRLEAERGYPITATERHAQLIAKMSTWTPDEALRQQARSAEERQLVERLISARKQHAADLEAEAEAEAARPAP